MNLFSPSRRTTRRAAVLAATGFAGVVVFQIALVAGAPWGHAAWGGADAQLSSAQRAGSAVAVVVWTIAALVVLGRAGYWGDSRLAPFFRWGTWFFAALSAVGALLNFASQSQWENAIFGPLAVLFAILCTVVARGAANARRRAAASGAPA
jgi:hypothetical protein